jgi:hypothetical protein
VEIHFDKRQLASLQAKIRDAGTLAGPPVRRFFQQAGAEIERAAKNRAPRFTGDLQRSITHRVDQGELPGFVVVGSNVSHAPFVHGFFDTTATRTKPHFPPVKGPRGAALRAWAKAKGIPVYAVAWSIARKGTPLVPFLKLGFEASQATIDRLARNAERAIKRRFG